MRKHVVTVLLTAACALLLAPAQPQRTDEAGLFLQRKERWAVKTGADPAARQVRTGSPQATTVARLIQLRRPPELPRDATSVAAQTSRYGLSERTVFTIDADILRYKLETDDHDYHIVIRDHDDFRAEDPPIESGRRRTMVVEIPEEAVVIASSPWRKSIAAARREFTSLFHPHSRFTYRVIHARITGVGFFDFIHGQSGAAPNGIELHPVLHVEVIDAGQVITNLHRSQADAAEASRPRVSANGQVWVNLSSGVYWRPGTRYYGKTKRGAYMREDEAIKSGYHTAGGQ